MIQVYVKLCRLLPCDGEDCTLSKILLQPRLDTECYASMLTGQHTHNLQARFQSYFCYFLHSLHFPSQHAICLVPRLSFCAHAAAWGHVCHSGIAISYKGASHRVKSWPQLCIQLCQAMADHAKSQWVKEQADIPQLCTTVLIPASLWVGVTTNHPWPLLPLLHLSSVCLMFCLLVIFCLLKK